MVDGLSDRGSTPLRSIKNSIVGLGPTVLFFVVLNEIDIRRVRKLSFRTGALNVRWTFVSADRSEAENDSPVESV